MTLRPSQIEVLKAVDGLPDGAMASDVAVRLDISIAAAEKRIERLDTQGFVANHQIRWPHAKSGWITLATLTARGQEALK